MTNTVDSLPAVTEPDAVVEAPKPVVKPTVHIDDFGKLDIRAGTIKSAERVPNADRLLKLEVSFGDFGTRTIVAGIAESFTPEAVVGRQSAFILNLPPRKMKGVLSNGMILAGKRSDGVISLLQWGMPVPDGAEVG